MSVAPAAPAASAEHVLVGHSHIIDDFATLRVFDKSSGWNGNNDVCPVFTVLFSTFSVFSALGNELSLIAECKKRISSGIDTEYNASASATVATVRTTGINVLLAVECNGTVSDVTCHDVYFDVIYKHSYKPPLGVI